MGRPELVVRASLRHVFASPFALALSVAGFAILGLGILVGPTGAVLGVAVLGGMAWQWRRLRRMRIVVDADGPGAALRIEQGAGAVVPLDEIAGGVVHRTLGSTYRGIRTGADVERWLVVGHDGRILARLDGRGFHGRDLATVRDRTGGRWLSAHDALRLGMLPADAPWDLRRPRSATALAIVAVVVVAIALVAGFVALTRVGVDAFVWPWW